MYGWYKIIHILYYLISNPRQNHRSRNIGIIFAVRVMRKCYDFSAMTFIIRYKIERRNNRRLYVAPITRDHVPLWWTNRRKKKKKTNKIKKSKFRHPIRRELVQALSNFDSPMIKVVGRGKWCLTRTPSHFSKSPLELTCVIHNQPQKYIL